MIEMIILGLYVYVSNWSDNREKECLMINEKVREIILYIIERLINLILFCFYYGIFY